MLPMSSIKAMVVTPAKASRTGSQLSNRSLHATLEEHLGCASLVPTRKH
jgi:hypothetical protein